MSKKRNLPVTVPTGSGITAGTARASESPALVYLARLAPRSRRSQRQALEAIRDVIAAGAPVEAVPWHELRYQHTQAVRAKLADGRYAPATANRLLCALRGVLKEAWRLGLLAAEDYHRAADIEPVRGSSLPAGREVQRTEIVALFETCAADRSLTGRRDAALIALLYGGGLRRSEAVGLDLEDFTPVPPTLRVQGKGNKEREVPLDEGAGSAIGAWLEVRGSEPGPILCPISKSGRIRLARLSDQGLFWILRRRAGEAGLASLSPHDFRRSLISHLLDAGADIATVQRLVGHAKVDTTSRYDRRGEAAKRRAVRLVGVPFHDRD